MKKVGIITIISANYGNRLQNYALQEFLRSLGIEIETLDYERPVPVKMTGYLKKYLKALARRLLMRRSGYFERFDRNITWKNVAGKRISTADYDYFIAGSDQVWNPTYDWLDKKITMLTFALPKQKIAYSASIGVDEIPEPQKADYQNWLKDFKAISVREGSGADIVERLTGKRPPVLIDPTLTMCAADWKRVERKPQSVDTNCDYILTYFLGEVSQANREEIQNLSAKYDLPVYDLADPAKKNLYRLGPAEFLYMISHAKLVLTDSFHGSVFSLIYGKPFLVYKRVGSEEKTFSRIETFLDKFALKRKYVESGLENDPFEADYSLSYERLAIEQKKARDYLKEVLELP